MWNKGKKGKIVLILNVWHTLEKPFINGELLEEEQILEAGSRVLF